MFDVIAFVFPLHLYMLRTLSCKDISAGTTERFAVNVRMFSDWEEKWKGGSYWELFLAWAMSTNPVQVVLNVLVDTPMAGATQYVPSQFHFEDALQQERVLHWVVYQYMIAGFNCWTTVFAPCSQLNGLEAQAKTPGAISMPCNFHYVCTIMSLCTQNISSYSRMLMLCTYYWMLI